MSKHSFLSTICLLILISLLSSCNSETNDTIPNKVVCVLFDLSETTNKPEIRKTYLNKFKLILGKMNKGDVIEAALITEKSVSELNLSIEHSFTAIEISIDNDMMIKAQKRISDSLMQVQKDSLLHVADSVLFRPHRKILDTEILSSLQVAERVLSSFPQKKKVLVIFSDMVEESSTANFAASVPTDNQIKNIITSQKKKLLVPSLKGVNVYCIGATAKRTEDYNSIRKFWLTFFKETGAELKDYGAALIRFDE